MSPKKENLPARPVDVRRDTTWRNRRMGDNLLLSQADIELINSIRPRCAKCGRPVDVISWTRPMDRPFHVRFTVECHGESETTSVSFDDLPLLLGGAVQGAEAFTGLKKLTKEKNDAVN